jgi:hypothetical protein
MNDFDLRVNVLDKHGLVDSFIKPINNESQLSVVLVEELISV